MHSEEERGDRSDCRKGNNGNLTGLMCVFVCPCVDLCLAPSGCSVLLCLCVCVLQPAGVVEARAPSAAVKGSSK